MSDYDSMTYEEFGRSFFEIAVTEERVGAAIAAIAGPEFAMGPMAQGPGRSPRSPPRCRCRSVS